MGLLSQPGGKRLGQGYATAHGNDIDVFGGTLQENVAYITADNIAGNAQLIGCCGKKMKERVPQMFLQ